MDRNALMQRYWDSLAPAQPRQQYGGVLDQLGIVPPQQDTPDRNGLMDRVGQGAALLDHWTMGIPTTVAGLVNSAIPGQPLGDLSSIKDNAETARSDLARSGYGDFLALPDAFAGSVPGGVGHGAAKERAPGVRLEPRRSDLPTLGDLDEFNIVNKGKRVGDVSVGTREDGSWFASPYVRPENQGQGIGTEVYQELSRRASDRGTVLQPDSTLTPAGYELWKSINPDAVDGFRWKGNHWSRPDGVKPGGSAPVVPIQEPSTNASAYLDLFGAGTRQAGRLAESAIDPIYQAMPDNSVGMFGGRLAKTADHAALAKAEELTASGAPRDQIWQDTGWFQGKDGKWRFEIDDSDSGWNWMSGASERLEQGATLGGAYDHRQLFKAYPDFQAMPLGTEQGPYGGRYTGKQAGGPRIDVTTIETADGKPYRVSDEYLRSKLLHETQHAGQEQEGFARGGQPRMFTPDEIAAERARLMAAPDNATGWTSVSNVVGDMPDLDVGRSLYRRLAGEVEARTVQKRMDLTPDQRRARAPWLDYDVPESDQIVRFGGSGPQLSNAVGSAGGKLGPQLSDNAISPKGITAYHGSPHDGPMRVYHGNDANVDFDKFRTGPWMTESPEIASAAAGDAGASLPPELQHLRSNSRPKVYPLDIEPKNPFFIDYNDKNPMLDAIQRYGYTSLQFGNDAHEVARANGHDFVIYKNTPGDFNLKKNHLQIVPLNENSVRSATTGKIMYGLPAAASMYGMDQVSQAMADQDQTRNALMPSY